MGNQNFRPGKQNDPFYKILWLLCAFIPGVVAGVCFQTRINGNWLLPVLLGLDFACSVAGSVGLVRGMKSKEVQAIVGVLLTIFFLVANAIIALFVGCSGGGGRIAP